MDYRAWALLSAAAAGATAVLGKKGVETVPTNLAVAIRVGFVLVFSVLVAAATRQWQLREVSTKAWLFLGASAVTTAISWLAYYRALKLGPVSQVAPIDKLSFVIAMVLGVLILHETVSMKTAAGAVLIVAGVLLTLAR